MTEAAIAEFNTAIPDPEVIPAMDENPIQWGENLAFDEPLCKEVLKHIVTDYFYTYENQQRAFWPVWRKIDDMWRSKVNATDLQWPILNAKMRNQSQPTVVDGISAMAQSPAAFKQMKALTDIIVQMSWQEGSPGKYQKPECVYEHPLYNPTQQAIDAANEGLQEDIDECNIQHEYRVNIGQYVKYGHAWVLVDFEKELETIQEKYNLNPQMAQGQVQQLAMQYGANPTAIEPPSPFKPYVTVTFHRQVIKKMVTHFRHLNVRDVFIDQLLPCNSMEIQPCPMVRRHMTDYGLETNIYHPQANPFGWLNTKMASQDQRAHWAYNETDEQTNRDAIVKRQNVVNIQQVKGKEATKQLWTIYPLLRIDANGRLDTGNGLQCEHCAGRGRMTVMTDIGSEEQPCPECEGTGTIHPPAKRYVVQVYGGMRLGGTVLRIQELPEKLSCPPLLFGADMVEDDAIAIPSSRAEIAMIPMYHLAKAECQMQDSKDYTIYRPWKKRYDSPSVNLNCNEPNGDILFETDPNEIQRADGNQYDETVTLIQHIQRKEDDIQRIFGATDQLLGLLATGRRSAMEVGNALEAGKNPIIVMSDGYNRQIFGGWMKCRLRNIELFGDRDFIKRKTGKTTFGKPKIYTSVASDFFKKSVLINNVRYLMEAANMNPLLQQAVPTLFNETAKLMGVDIQINDGGLKKIQQDGFRIITKILGEGILEPPIPSDPHQVYVDMFQQAFEDPFWQKSAPQNLPLLAQRIMWQQQMLMQQQFQQAQMQNALNPPQEEPESNDNGNRPKKPGEPASTPGKQMQQAQG